METVSTRLGVTMHELMRLHDTTSQEFVDTATRLGWTDSGAFAEKLQTDLSAAFFDPEIPDARLTETGEDEARHRLTLARKYGHFNGVQLVVSSPQSRTMKTACIVFEDVLKDPSVPALTNECIREIIIDAPSEIPRPPADLKKDFPRFDFRDVDSSFAREGGTWKSARPDWLKGHAECLDMKDMMNPEWDKSPLINRAREALHWLLRLPQSEIGVVTHGMIFRVGFEHFLRREIEHMAEQELEEAGVPRWNTMMNNAELRTCELWSDNTGTVRLKPIFTSNLHDAKGKRRKDSKC